MNIIVRSLFFTLTVLLDHVESMDHAVATVEYRNGIEYGLRFNDIVYPKGTYALEPAQGGTRMIPHFIGTVTPLPEDRVCHDGKVVGRPMGLGFIALHPNGQPVLYNGQLVAFQPQNGYYLVRDWKSVAIYETREFHQLEHRLQEFYQFHLV